MIDFASSLWNQRKNLIDSKKRLGELCESVNRPADFTFPDWIQLYSLVLEFSPDLIIELGRGYGNSTCLFTEAVNKSGKGKVVSVGYDSEHAWEKTTVPALQKLISPQWLDKLCIKQQDIMKTDFTEITQQAQHVLLFWDAHGKELAQYLLAHLFPLLQNKEHLIVMHDVTDTGNSTLAPPTEYDNKPKIFRIHNLVSTFEEIIPLFDFISTNGILYDSLRESIRRFVRKNEQTSPDMSQELKNTWNELVGDNVSIERSHMIYFDVNNKTNKGKEND